MKLNVYEKLKMLLVAILCEYKMAAIYRLWIKTVKMMIRFTSNHQYYSQLKTYYFQYKECYTIR